MAHRAFIKRDMAEQERRARQVANEIEYPHEAKPAFLIGNRRVQLQHFIADRGERGGTALSIGHEPVPKINDALIHILYFRPWRPFWHYPTIGLSPFSIFRYRKDGMDGKG